MSLQGTTKERILKRKIVEIKKKIERNQSKVDELTNDKTMLEDELELLGWWIKSGF